MGERFPQTFEFGGKPMPFEAHPGFGTLDEAFPMSSEPITLEPGQDLRELAERVYSERRFDAWADRVDAELREAFGVGNGGDG